MTETVKEIVEPQVVTKATNSQTYEYLVYYFFGAVEVLLAFRIILKLAGANTYSTFVSLVYGITGVFVLPFLGIFHQGTVAASVFEPSTIVALIAYAVLAWGIVKLLRIMSGQQQES